MLVVSAVALAGGCVERRFVIQTDPPGALVYQNGVPLGPAPVDGEFTYYGTYHFSLVKDGFETTHVEQRIAPPWFAYPPFDFVVENLWPLEVKDVRRFQYTMNPLPQPRVDQLLQDAEELRARGRALPPPTPPDYPELQPEQQRGGPR